MGGRGGETCLLCKLESCGHSYLTDNNILKAKSYLIDKKNIKRKTIKMKQMLY